MKAALNAGGHRPVSISNSTIGKPSLTAAVPAGATESKFGTWHGEAMHAADRQHSR